MPFDGVRRQSVYNMLANFLSCRISIERQMVQSNAHKNKFALSVWTNQMGTFVQWNRIVHLANTGEVPYEISIDFKYLFMSTNVRNVTVTMLSKYCIRCTHLSWLFVSHVPQRPVSFCLVFPISKVSWRTSVISTL